MTEKKKKLVEAEQISLHRVKIAKGHLNAEDNAIEDNNTELQTKFGLEIESNVQENLIRMLFTIGIQAISENNKEIATAEYTIDFVFVVEELVEFMDQTGTTPVVSNHLAATLISIVYSTSRGIILTRTQGTIFENFILPVINPVTLLRQMVDDNEQHQTEIKNHS